MPDISPSGFFNRNPGRCSDQGFILYTSLYVYMWYVNKFFRLYVVQGLQIGRAVVGINIQIIVPGVGKSVGRRG